MSDKRGYALSETMHLVLTCPSDLGILDVLVQDITLWLSQRGSPATIFFSGYMAKDEERAFVVLECEQRLFPWPLSNWLALDARVLSFSYYNIPLFQEPPHAAHVLAALETWLKEQRLEIIPDHTTPGSFRVVSIRAAKEGAYEHGR